MDTRRIECRCQRYPADKLGVWVVPRLGVNRTQPADAGGASDRLTRRPVCGPCDAKRARVSRLPSRRWIGTRRGDEGIPLAPRPRLGRPDKSYRGLDRGRRCDIHRLDYRPGRQRKTSHTHGKKPRVDSLVAARQRPVRDPRAKRRGRCDPASGSGGGRANQTSSLPGCPGTRRIRTNGRRVFPLTDVGCCSCAVTRTPIFGVSRWQDADAVSHYQRNVTVRPSSSVARWQVDRNFYRQRIEIRDRESSSNWRRTHSGDLRRLRRYKSGLVARWQPDRVLVTATRRSADRVIDPDVRSASELKDSAAETQGGIVDWLPDGRVLDPAGFKELRDPRSKVRRPRVALQGMGRSETVARMVARSERFPRNGHQLALWWQPARMGEQDDGLWLMEWPSRAARKLLVGDHDPAGWKHQTTGRSMPMSISVGVSSEFPPQRARRSPLDSFPQGALEGCDVSPDAKIVICAVRETKSDAWLVENFDPKLPVSSSK